ncbi:cytochrome c oxidase assembly protein [Herbaspirillum sp. GCM10030257]|uniref:cytochrome c oxidase assembly protein n=1 Tax=Herbaspirillum sp. GCM10030257 TaxID=3273393 RepID=UPI00361053C4
MRLPFLPFCMLVFNAGLVPAAAAHDTSSPAIGFSIFTWPVDESLAMGGALLFWMVAAWRAARAGGTIAAALLSAAVASAVWICVVLHLDAWIVASLFVSCWLYAAGLYHLRQVTRHSTRSWARRAVFFNCGLAVLVVALLSPVEMLGEELFAMHMVQHELLMLGAAPLIVAGRPLVVFIWAFPAAWRRHIASAIKSPAILGPWTALTRPLVTWSLHALILWVWHFPSLFQAGLTSNTVHTVQHLSFLLSALLFWSSILGPHAWLRHGIAVPYLLTTAIHTGILGALLTFSPRAWYPLYATRTEYWGVTPLQDQQLGGLIMWVPAGFVFVFVGLALAARLIVPPIGSRPQGIPPAGSRS